ncbi:protein kinase [Streptomyces sp. NBC_00572]|uniref:protein kinase domain-containing protein n=1 Tax=Streptomyces sp. NBC_00572 TaxID=2903664 RepID=UPI0022592996|nr:protein kinase [Streptomyces sp. NBC_00572]MCX4980460.1 protein kinase [Streptomyces sp. NBC_00572]
MRGTVLDGRYELETRLGRGGMGQVWSALDRRMHRDVAVKLVTALPEMGEEETFLRFRREIRSAASLPGRYAVAAYDCGATEIDGERALYLVMERLTGRTLTRAVHEDRPHWTVTVDWARQLATALDAAHSRRIVHRDLKPDNVMFDEDGDLRILDFGIAKFLGDTVRIGGLTGTGVAIGTLLYMSPEQALGERSVDHRTDLYSLGCVLYFALTGRAPFAADNMLGLINQKLHGTERPPHHHVPGIPDGLSALVMDLLAREPGHRPASAKDLLARLHDLAPSTAPGALMATDVGAERDRILAEAEREARARRDAADALFDETRTKASQAAADFETHLKKRREQAEQDLATRQAKAEERLAEIEHRAEQLRLEAVKLRRDSERRARQVVADARAEADALLEESRAELAAGLGDVAELRSSIGELLADSKYQPLGSLAQQREGTLRELEALHRGLSALSETASGPASADRGEAGPPPDRAGFRKA